MDEKKKNQMYYTKPGPLVELKGSMNKLEQDILAMVLSQINPSDEDFKEYTLKIKDYIDLSGKKGRSIYKDIHESCKSIMGKKLTFKTERNSIMTSSIITNAESMENKGEVKILLDPKLKPLFFELKREIGFTKVFTKNFINIKGSHSKRIYELLKKWSNTKSQIEFQIIDLKKILGIENMYVNFKDFERNVLKPAKKDINAVDENGNKLTDMMMDYEKIKRGRNIERILFTFYIIREEETIIDIPIEIIENINENIDFKKYKFTDSQKIELHRAARELLDKYNMSEMVYKYINSHISYMSIQEDIVGIEIKNYYAYLKSAIEGNYMNIPLKTSIKVSP